MRQDARKKRSAPGAEMTAVSALCAPDASGQYRIDVYPKPQHIDRPLTLGRIGPRTLPRIPRDWHARGIELERTGDLPGAIEHYRHALQCNGPQVQVAFDLAHALAATGQTQQAVERYRQVIELDATRADAWANLADLLLDLDQTGAGLDALHQALELDPHDPTLHYNLADALDEAEQRFAALAHYRTFLALTDLPLDDPHVAYAWRRLNDPA